MLEETKQDFFKIQTNDKLGRFAIATKQLNPGDFIFEEIPFAYGPKSDSPAVCLGCHTKVNCKNLCTKCHWPVCDEKCESLPVHKDAECSIFSAAKVKFQPLPNPNEVCLQLECITPLRVLLAKERNPIRWQKEIEPMESHDDIRQTKEIWHFNQINIANYLRGPCKLSHFPPELIHKICGILEVNAFEARTQLGHSIRCLYPKLAILSHNCVSNITHSIDCNGAWDENDFTVQIRAATEIAENSELFSSYTYSLWPTIIRRQFLNESKFFECKCKRCCDPTELGTNMSSLKCNQCNDGLILATNPLSFDSNWECGSCKFAVNSNTIQKLFNGIQAEIDSIINGKESIENYEDFLEKYARILHYNHSYLTIVRSNLNELYSKIPIQTLDKASTNILGKRIEICRELLTVLDVIEPGHSRIRGVNLFYLHSLMIQLAKENSMIGFLSKEEFLIKLKEIRGILEESVDILCNEPTNSIEGSLGRIAENALMILNEYNPSFNLL